MNLTSYQILTIYSLYSNTEYHVLRISFSICYVSIPFEKNFQIFDFEEEEDGKIF